MSLQIFIKQDETWSDINEDVSEFSKYHNFIESLNTKKDVKGLPRFVAEHVVPVLEKKGDQTNKNMLKIIDVAYGRIRTEKVEEWVKDWLKLKEDQFEEDDELMLALTEINQRRKELQISQEDWFSI